MINNIKDILSNDSPVQKRNLVDLAKKLEHVVNIYHEVKAFATVAYDVYELVVDIKNMFADSDSAEHKDLVDVARRIEEIVKDTVIFLHTGNQEETHKRDTGYNFWPVKKEKAHMLSRRENQWSVKKEKAHKYSRRGTVLDVATMANAKFAEIKKFLEPFENLE